MLCVFCIKRQNYKKERKYQHIALLYCSILLPDNFFIFFSVSRFFPGCFQAGH